MTSMWMELLWDFDISGSYGCHFNGKTSILVKDLIDLGNDIYKATQLTPEGCSTSQTLSNWINYNRDDELDSVTLLWDTKWSAPCSNRKYFLCGVQENFPSDKAVFTLSSDSIIMPVDHQKGTNRIHWLELFSGGYAGWTRGLHLLRDHHQIDVQSIAIEYDIRIAHNLAVSLGIPLLDGTRLMPQDVLVGMTEDCVIHADITQKLWHSAIAEWKPDAVSISAPCQPWSSAGTGSGLQSLDGMAASESIAICKFLRPKFILYETVAGFITHDHHHKILQQFAWAGYKIRWSKLVDCKDVLPTSRIRWLALLYRIAEHDNSLPPFQFWHPKPCSPIDFDAIHDEFDCDESLLVTDEIKTLASRHDLLPPGQRPRVPIDQALQSRCHNGTKILPTFMASYGSQHCFDESTLRSRGFLSHYYQPKYNIIRHWHPSEILAIHANYGRHFVVNDRKLSYLVLGNQITVHHALLLIVNGLRMIPQHATLDLHEVLNTLNVHRFKFEQSYCLETNTGSFFSSQPISILEKHLNEIDSFLNNIEAERLPQGHCWTFDGFLPWTSGPVTKIESLEEPPAAQNFECKEIVDSSDITPICQSPITQEDKNKISPTLAFVPVLLGKIVTSNGELKFWFQESLPFQTILAVWGFEYQIDFYDADSECSLQLSPTTVDTLNIPTKEYIMCLFQDNMLTLMHSNPDSLKAASQNHDIKLRDQFESVSEQPLTPFLVVSPECESDPSTPDVKNESHADVADGISFGQFFVASNMCVNTAAWDPNCHSLYLTFQGPFEATQILVDFWQTILPVEILQQCGYLVQTAKLGHGHQCIFAPISTRCPMPIFAFRAKLVIQAFRFFAATFRGEGRQITIKWLSRPLWKSSVPLSLELGYLLDMFDCLALPMVSKLDHRFVHKGRNAARECTVSDFTDDNQEFPLTFHLIGELSGGGPTTTKSGHRIQIKNSLASVLLEEGYDLKWVSESIETLFEKQGMKKVTPIASLPQGPAKLKEITDLLSASSIRIPTIKTALSSSHSHQAKNRKKIVMPNPDDYRIKPGFLFNQDGTDANQIQDFAGHLSGIMLCTPDFATPWIRDGRQISADELALAIIGEPTTDVGLSNKKINIPCVDPENRDVLLACTLIQFGEKSLLPKSQETTKVQQVGCSLVAVTLWKTDWSEDWGRISQNPYQFLKQQLNSEEVVTIWGKSFRKGRNNCSPAESTSIQMHCAIKDAALTDILRTSGYNKLWMTPKNQQGRPCDRWKLIWLPHDTDLAQSRILAAHTPGAAGIARSKDRLALRVDKAKFSTAWEVVYPGATPPKDIPTNVVYKIESLPFGATAETVQSWAEQFQWIVKPLRAVGPTSWIVGCEQGPKPMQLTFNGNPVLVRALPPKVGATVHPVVAGPRPIWNSSKREEQSPPIGHLISDPWANWQGPKPTLTWVPNVPRSLPGPQEARMAAQDERIAKLEETIEKVHEQQNNHDAKLIQFQDDVKQQDVAIRTHIDQRLQQVKAELDASFSGALQQQSKNFDDNMRELKQMLGAVSKRKALAQSPEDAEM